MDSPCNVLQTFAVNNAGEIVHVDDVTRGGDCDCRCPACNQPLIARQGDIRQWHFAHTPGTDCYRATQSALHRAAKEAIIRAGGLALPNATSSYRHRTDAGQEFIGSAEQPYGWIDFVDAFPEATFGRVRADLWLQRPGLQLLVEIAVTHQVDREKAALIQTLGMPTIEVHLDALRSEAWSWADLGREVVHAVANKAWICAPDHLLLDQRARAEAEARAAATAAQVSIKVRHRFEIRGMYVDVTERDFGICVWSSFHPEVSPIVSRICRALGGRWRAKFRNWVVPVLLLDQLLDQLRRLHSDSSA